MKMWRLWTNGWYLSGWWAWVKDSTPMWLACHLPKRVAYWAFIRCYAFDGQSPGPEYKRVCKAWEAYIKESK